MFTVQIITLQGRLQISGYDIYAYAKILLRPITLALFPPIFAFPHEFSICKWTGPNHTAKAANILAM